MAEGQREFWVARGHVEGGEIEGGAEGWWELQECRVEVKPLEEVS